MKKLLLTLFLLLALPALARAETRVLSDRAFRDVYRLFGGGDALYLVSDALYALRDDAEDPEIWADAVALPQAEDGSWRFGFDGLDFFLDGDALRGWKLLRGDELLLCDIALDGGEVRAENAKTYALPKPLRQLGVDSIARLFAQDGAYYLLGEGDGGPFAAAVTASGCAAQALEGWDCDLFPGEGGAWVTMADIGAFRFTAEGALEPLCALPENARPLAADPARRRLIVAHEGALCAVDIDSGALSEPLAPLPARNVSQAVLLSGERCAVRVQEGVLILELNADAPRAPLVIRAENNLPQWVDSALLDFMAAHPDVAPGFDYLDMDRLLDDLLTRSDAVDIYVLPVNSPQFEALRDRGYLLPLDGSAALSDLVSGMYPALAQAFSHDGAAVALPLSATGESIGFGEGLLQKLGLSLADVPDDWAGVLDFIEDALPRYVDRLDPEDRRAYGGLQPSVLREQLFRLILFDWACAAHAQGEIPDYEDPRLVALLERLETLRFEALDLDEDRERDPNDFFAGGWSQNGGEYLFCFNLETAFHPYGWYDAGTPVLPGFGDGRPGPLALKLTAAVVNPYSPRRETALAWLEALANAMPATLRCTLSPQETQAVRRPEADEALDFYTRTLEDLQARLDAAPSEEAQALAQERDVLKREYEKYLADEQWLIPQARLDWYRAHGDAIVPACATWFEGDASDEATALIAQYQAGQLSCREFLAALNKKARMMALEAN